MEPEDDKVEFFTYEGRTKSKIYHIKLKESDYELVQKGVRKYLQSQDYWW